MNSLALSLNEVLQSSRELPFLWVLLFVSHILVWSWFSSFQDITTFFRLSYVICCLNILTQLSYSNYLSSSMH